MCRFDVLDWKERDAFQMQLADDCKDEFAPFVRMMGFGPTLVDGLWAWMCNTTIIHDADYVKIFDQMMGWISGRHDREQVDLLIKIYPSAEQAWQAFFEVVLA